MFKGYFFVADLSLQSLMPQTVIFGLLNVTENNKIVNN